LHLAMMNASEILILIAKCENNMSTHQIRISLRGEVEMSHEPLHLLRYMECRITKTNSLSIYSGTITTCPLPCDSNH
jgi:hypothetical protein